MPGRAQIAARRRPLAGGAFLTLACLTLFAAPLRAQEVPAAPAAEEGAGALPATPIMTLDQDAFFRDSAYGKAALAQAEADAAALSAENRRLEAALEAEERALTERRAAMKPEEFAPLAAAFDAKVEDIRSAQDAKLRSITRQIEEEQERYFEAAKPVLADLLRDTGAVAILADNAIIMSLSAIDVTDEAVARMDLLLPGPGGEPAETPPAPPVPENPAPDPLPPVP